MFNPRAITPKEFDIGMDNRWTSWSSTFSRQFSSVFCLILLGTGGLHWTFQWWTWHPFLSTRRCCAVHAARCNLRTITRTEVGSLFMLFVWCPSPSSGLMCNNSTENDDHCIPFTIIGVSALSSLLTSRRLWCLCLDLSKDEGFGTSLCQEARCVCVCARFGIEHADLQNALLPPADFSAGKQQSLSRQSIMLSVSFYTQSFAQIESHQSKIYCAHQITTYINIIYYSITTSSHLHVSWLGGSFQVHSCICTAATHCSWGTLLFWKKSLGIDCMGFGDWCTSRQVGVFTYILCTAYIACYAFQLWIYFWYFWQVYCKLGRSPSASALVLAFISEHFATLVYLGTGVCVLCSFFKACI